jgi:hypothetical protein
MVNKLSEVLLRNIQEAAIDWITRHTHAGTTQKRKYKHACHGFDTVYVQFREGPPTTIRWDMKQQPDNESTLDMSLCTPQGASIANDSSHAMIVNECLVEISQV